MVKRIIAMLVMLRLIGCLSYPALLVRTCSYLLFLYRHYCKSVTCEALLADV